MSGLAEIMHQLGYAVEAPTCAFRRSPRALRRSGLRSLRATTPRISRPMRRRWW